ncbi:centrosomal protein of 162 kDa isoform X2 [Nerophis ophidion]|uniref:centrosomal protein of 162 kDa isoform X2 n=1 Tax=Nerophis ophidion TaxID=159077 RepID=UPI002AE0156B|nr:centrosomal protein of 162 kDa isoform X2 [Nerophis ophidion]
MSHIMTKEKVNEQFELFLKESLSDDSGDFCDKQPDSPGSDQLQKATVPPWQSDEHEHKLSSGVETVVTKSRFLKTKKPQMEDEELFGSLATATKSLRKSRAVEEEDDYITRNTGLKDLTRESSHAEALNLSIGLDTLVEEEEKVQFFGQFEASALSNIDYRQLNKEMDITSSTTGSFFRVAEESVYPSDDDQKKRESSPCLQHYSEDFEDDDVEIKKLRISPIFTKVSLDDPHNDFIGQTADRGKEVPEFLDKGGLSNAQSAGSDMEALHNAYRQIHTGEDSDDPKHHHPPPDRNESRLSLSSQQPIESPGPASTNESELPTAEELMRPIRPVSAVEPDEKICNPLDRTFIATKNTKQKETSEKAEIGKFKGAKTLKTHQSSHAKRPNLGVTFNVREEVERLMEEQTTVAQTDKAKKEPNHRGSPSKSTLTPSVRKLIVATPKVQKDDSRRLKGVNKTTAGPKSQSSVSRTMRPCLKTAKNKEKENANPVDTDVNVSNELVVSVQSLVTVLKQQINASSRQDVTDGQDCKMPTTSKDISAEEELRLQLAQRDQELQIMKKEAEELKSVQQQNYLLQSKLQIAEEASKKLRLTDTRDPTTEKTFKDIHKEITEQETIIKGFQQENEKLCLQMKAQQAKSKANEQAMFNENQRLQSEVVFAREQLNKSSFSLDQRIKDLIAHINTSQMKETKLSEDIHRLKQENQALLVDMELLRKERDMAKMQSSSNTGGFPEDKHRDEVAALKKKLQWFVENQEVHSRNEERLEAATAEIHLLKEQVEKMKAEVGKKSTAVRKNIREKPIDLKKMQDLEQQVKHLENLLRSRNAKTSAKEGVANSRKSTSSCINTLLERRVQRIEAEMDSRDEAAKQTLHDMEQQFQKTKLQYEHQIAEMEQHLKQKEELAAAAAISASSTESWVSQIERMKVELEHIKTEHEQKETFLQEQVDALKKQLKQKALSSPGRHNYLAKDVHASRISQLNQKLATKTRTIDELTSTVERLQKERRSMLSGSNLGSDAHFSESKQQQSPIKAGCSECSFSLKEGSRITEVLQENEALRERVKLLQVNSELEREALKSNVLQAKEELCRQRDLFFQQISSLKAEHLKALDQLRADHATEYSSSKLSRLLMELKDAKEAQSPEVKHLRNLESKIVNMEQRHQHREKELQQMIAGSWVEGDQQSKVEHWKCVAVDKARELEAFRLELDSILDIVRHLQRQGVTVPTP